MTISDVTLWEWSLCEMVRLWIRSTLSSSLSRTIIIIGVHRFMDYADKTLTKHMCSQRSGRR